MSYETKTEEKAFATFNMPLSINEQVVEDILITAFDSAYGGCNYFLDCYPATVGKRRGQDIFESFAKYKQNLRVTLDEESDNEVHILTPTKFLNGLRLAIQNGLPLAALTNEEPADATQADCIIQYAIFGKLIYG